MSLSKSFLRIAIALVVSTFTACSVTLYEPVAENTSADVTLEQLKQGKTLYSSTCNRCHSLYNPQRFSREKWTKNLAKMQPKAKISDDQKAMIYSYLTHNPNRKK